VLDCVLQLGVGPGMEWKVVHRSRARAWARTSDAGMS
jgi:hypothetical protein